MKKIHLAIIMFLGVISSQAQEEKETLGKKIDEITFYWDLEAANLNGYDGLLKFCNDKTYRFEVIDLMKSIHHYDSILYSRLLKANRLGGASREVKKAIKEIEKFETDYSAKEFIHFLHEECINAKDIERHSDDLKSDKSYDSYDGQILIVENLLNKYIKHITKRVDHVRDHVHHLHIK